MSSQKNKKTKDDTAKQKMIAEFMKTTKGMTIVLPNFEQWLEQAKDATEIYLKTKEQPAFADGDKWARYIEKTDVYIWEKAIEEILEGISDFSIINRASKGFLGKLMKTVIKENPAIKQAIGENHNIIQQAIKKRIFGSDIIKRLKKDILNYFSEEKISQLLSENPHHKEYYERYSRADMQNLNEKQMILENIPEDYIDLYPSARTIKRHFVIHSGPTNSGKTYNSIQAFLNAKKGVYLAPLRLLAFETFETANKEGVFCSMVTGEENIDVPFSVHIASTIEMLDTEEYYDVAVIDEAQMLADAQRGGAWVTAILGVYAREVHICTAPHAVNIILKMIEDCGDTYEIHTHERLTPLIPCEEKFKFPKSVKTKDALILFSKKAVLACAADLQKNGIKTSVIYGALPYDVRRNEVDKFVKGETDVVVATDAIGMGVNLPIKRIVFLESSKFDGIERRSLKSSEVQQIAGRAGRKGIFDVGYFTSMDNKSKIKEQLGEKIPDIETAHLDCPRHLLTLDMPLSKILSRWNEIPNKKFYTKANIEREIDLCKWLEKKSSDKKLVFDFITMPFDEQNDKLLNMWYSFFEMESNNPCDCDNRIEDILHGFSNYNWDCCSLNDLEYEFQKCDLICFYLNKFNHKKYLEQVMRVKKNISKAIITILAEQQLKGRTCKRCGKSLKWNHQFSICNKCYHEGYRRFF